MIIYVPNEINNIIMELRRLNKYDIENYLKSHNDNFYIARDYISQLILKLMFYKHQLMKYPQYKKTIKVLSDNINDWLVYLNYINIIYN
jgi:hypothetical protein